MHTIIALGNPGEKYENTRHNVGRIVVRDFLETHAFPALTAHKPFKTHSMWAEVGGERVEVHFPDTFMNESGNAVRLLVEKGEVNPEKMIVIYDDIDLPLGEMKISYGRGSGGHNGIESIIKQIKTKDFIRIRTGISPTSFFGKLKKPQAGAGVTRYVLGQFTGRQLKQLPDISKRVTKVLGTIIQEGKESAMNEYN